MTLEGKTALITGSTSGIGLGIAQHFASLGANIVINGFGDKNEIDTILQEIEGQGVKAYYSDADMSKEDAIEAMAEEAIRQFGGVDILVNNAGIQHVAPIDEFPVEKWNAIIAINLSSAFHTTRLFAPHMKERGWGRIINIASVHGLVASAYKAAYVAAKHGIMGLTKVAALDLAEHGITANAICPGYVKTPLVEAQIPQQAKSHGISEEEVTQKIFLKNHAVKDFVGVDDIAELASFLCSDAARTITGIGLPIDAGWSAQ